MTTARPETGDRPDEPRAVLRTLIARLAEGTPPGTARADLSELGRRLGATFEPEEPPAPETSREVGPC